MEMLRKKNERGHTLIDWLDSYHTFSFGDYEDAEHMGFGDLRVINEDRVKGGGGFGTHGHRDMEILTLVLEGALKHQDSMGNGSVILPGDAQLMSAGSGVKHSEHNASKTDAVHFLQIWIVPNASGLTPHYQQRSFNLATSLGTFTLIASLDGRLESLKINQDVDILHGRFNEGMKAEIKVAPQRKYWIQILRGKFECAGHVLQAGDGFAQTQAAQPIALKALTDNSEALVFNLKA